MPSVAITALVTLLVLVALYLWHRWTHRLPVYHISTLSPICTRCQGAGQTVDDHFIPCSLCRGVGRTVYPGVALDPIGEVRTITPLEHRQRNRRLFMRKTPIITAGLAIALVAAILLPSYLIAQPASPFKVALVPPSMSQTVLTVAPNTGATVNGTLTVTGASTFTGAISGSTVTASGAVTAKNYVATEGTLTSDLPALSSTATWNSGGTTFTHLKSNVTDTASAAGSLLLDLQVGGTSMAKISKGGVLTLAGEQTDFVVFFDAVNHCKADTPSATLAVVRVSANVWALARTAGGAETYNITCTFPLTYRTTSGKGAKVTGFKIAQQILTAALTSNTFNALATTTYVNNVAPAVAGYGGVITITMPTATQAQPYLTVGTVGTPAYMNTADAEVSTDHTIVMQNTGVYRLYGVSVAYSTALN